MARLGISIYPEHSTRERDIAYIRLAGRYGFQRVFTCLLSVGDRAKETIKLQVVAMEGIELLGDLQARYGDRIQILAGSGVNQTNARTLMERTGISQVHSSCKDWKKDPATAMNGVSYSFAAAPHEMGYNVVSKELTRQLIQSVKEQESPE